MSTTKTLIGKLAYNLTEQDKTDIAEIVAELLESEEWEFTLEDGSTVTKEVCLK